MLREWSPRFAILTSVEPLVSVVVPVFNGLPHLEALMRSLLQQTYPNLEIIVSEGGGTDSSLDFLMGIGDPRITIIEQPRGTSAAGNWTAVSAAATGDFTKLICQDDLVYPDAIEKQVSDLTRHPDAVMAIAQRDIIDARGSAIFRGRGLSGLRDDYVAGTTAIRECFRQGTNVIGEPLAVLFRTDALQRALPWQDDNPLMLDLSMYAKVAPTGEVAVRHESIGAFRVSNASWSTRLARQQLEQTKRWQLEYQQANEASLTRGDRVRGTLGRHVQTNLRRVAYSVLSARGRLDSST